MTRRTLALALGGIIALAAAPGAQSRRFITEQDLLAFTWIADPQMSPDGSTVAFVRVTVNEKESRYESSLFAVPADGSGSPRRLTSGIHDLAPRWSPDGRQLAFVRSIEKDGKSQPAQIYVLGLNGGEAQPITDLARDAGNPTWSPDGAGIAFDSRTGPESPKVDGRDNDVRVITRAVYRANGNPTYVDDEHHSHIFVVPLGTAPGEKAAPMQITDGEFDESGITWAPDGSKIYFTSTRVREPYYLEDGPELFSVPATGGSITKVASIDGDIGTVAISPDGKRVAFIGTLKGKPIRSYSQPDLWLADLAAPGAPVNLTDSYDYDIGGGIGGDQAAPRGQNRKPILWSRDGTSLITVAAEHGSSNLKRIMIATRRVEPLTEGIHDVAAYSATPDSVKIAATLSTQTSLGDIFTIARGSSPRRVTGVNEDLFRNITQSEPEEFWYKSFDGKNIQAWILKPPDFDPSKKYPLILEIHGGPHSAYGNTSHTSSNGWPLRDMSCCSRTPEGARLTDRNSATSFSSTIRATITRTSWPASTRS